MNQNVLTITKLFLSFQEAEGRGYHQNVVSYAYFEGVTKRYEYRHHNKLFQNNINTT